MFGLGKPRSKFGKYLDERGIKQQWVAEKSGVSRGTISQLAIDDERVPNFRNAQKIEKVLRQVDPLFSASKFWNV
ncbi:helix-turn-helix transcriptional regulator [Paenibacillus sp.]|uniref:helix-turn-helix domain-containing protein n=1 Tax=Paenibacillus sp. TaxID=58172 RepID=UPI002D518EEC|nr:helix-turn-helix transcriptional regulator [Paenibacillus sp.]HZG87285.1 helix-turn-helix transcriptional regulator [Paenibacillus sp.]